MLDAESVALGTILVATVGIAAAGVAFGSILAIAAGLGATALVLFARDDDGSGEGCPGCGRDLPDGRRRCRECSAVAGYRK